MPAWTKVAISDWFVAFIGAGAAENGPILRAVNKGDRIVGTGMTAQAIFAIVQQYGVEIGVPIAPHDLRRTFAKLANKGHAAIEQIQIFVGARSHSND